MSPTPATHLAIDRRLVGEPLELGAGTARAALTLLPEMAADDRGLVHGGFAFGLADYAAMLAVNHPLVVLASSSMKFLAPTRVGERLVAEARVVEETGRRRRVGVEVRRGDGETQEVVASGEFLAVVPDRHVLDPPNPKELPA
jgi:acyl-coenzyme A thioesterase PaaI-like protein